MSGSLHHSSSSSHLSPITVGMAKVLVRAMVVETVKKFGYDAQPRHILLQMVVFIRQIKQVAFIQIFFFCKNVRRVFRPRRVSLYRGHSLVIGGF